MMKRAVLAIATALVVGLLVPNASLAAPKTGATCPKKGKMETYKKIKYTCLKKNGRLTWSKGELAERASSISNSPSQTTVLIGNPAIDPSTKFVNNLLGFDRCRRGSSGCNLNSRIGK